MDFISYFMLFRATSWPDAYNTHLSTLSCYSLKGFPHTFALFAQFSLPVVLSWSSLITHHSAPLVLLTPAKPRSYMLICSLKLILGSSPACSEKRTLIFVYFRLAFLWYRGSPDCAVKRVREKTPPFLFLDLFRPFFIRSGPISLHVEPGKEIKQTECCLS